MRLRNLNRDNGSLTNPTLELYRSVMFLNHFLCDEQPKPRPFLNRGGIIERLEYPANGLWIKAAAIVFDLDLYVGVVHGKHHRNVG